MPLSTFYYKVKKDDIPVINKESISTSIVTNWIDGWNLPGRIQFRKVSRTRMSPCSPPIAVNRTLKLVAMEKTDTIILSPEELAAYMAESTISVTSTYEHSPVILMVDDTVIGTLGNFSASIGKAKARKLSTFQPLSHRHWVAAPFFITGLCSLRISGRFYI